MIGRVHATGTLITLSYDLAPVYIVLEQRAQSYDSSADEHATTLCTYISVRRGETRISDISFGPDATSVTTLWP